MCTISSVYECGHGIRMKKTLACDLLDEFEDTIAHLNTRINHFLFQSIIHNDGLHRLEDLFEPIYS